MAKSKQKKKPRAKPKAKPIAGYQRHIVLFEIENMIAEQREPAAIDQATMAKHGVSARTAADLREDALKALLGADESNRRERFKLVLRALRRLYVAAFDRNQFPACANILNQMREMFDLKEPFVEGGGATVAEHADRSVDDLLQYAEHGEWPEEAAKRAELNSVSTNPLDVLS
jgi:hypothetical protein